MTGTVSGWRRVLVLLLLPLFLAMPPGCSSVEHSAPGVRVLKAVGGVLLVPVTFAADLLALSVVAVLSFGTLREVPPALTVGMLVFMFEVGHWRGSTSTEGQLTKKRVRQLRLERMTLRHEREAARLAYQEALAAELLARMELHPQ